MSTEYFVINREAFELNQRRRIAWYNAVDDAIHSFSQSIQKSDVIGVDCESIGIEAIIKIQEMFNELYPLNAIKIGNTWCSDKGIRFVRYFGQTSRQLANQIWEDLKELANDDFETNLIIDECDREIPWDQFRSLIFKSIQRKPTQYFRVPQTNDNYQT